MPITYVCGHKSPDTDSVCSAISYAYLLQQIYPSKTIKPIVAGPIMEQTRFILNHFGISQPEVVMDVTPKLSQLADTKRYVLYEDEPIAIAFAAFYQQHQHQFPVVARTGAYVGMIQLPDILDQFIHPVSEAVLQTVTVTVRSLARAVRGVVIKGCERNLDEVLRLRLRIITSSVAVAAAQTEGAPYSESAFIVGDNPELLAMLIERGAAVIILSSDAYSRRPDSPECGPVEDLSESHLVSCCYDTKQDNTAAASTCCERSFPRSAGMAKAIKATGDAVVIQSELSECSILLLAKQAVPARLLANPSPTFVVRADQSLDDAVGRLQENPGVQALALLDHDGRFTNLLRLDDLRGVVLTELVLVDHNEPGQQVDGAAARGVRVIEIVDHHKVCIGGDIAIPRMTVKPVGCSCTILYEMFRQKRVQIPSHIQCLLMSAILTDTLVLRSPTATPKDKLVLEELQELSGISYRDWGPKIFDSVVGFNVPNKERAVGAD